MTEDNQPRYTTARLRREVDEAKRLARIHALEEAAKVAEATEEQAPDDEQVGDDCWFARTATNARARTIAAAIRELMKETP